jgi:hypothetical protein
MFKIEHLNMFEELEGNGRSFATTTRRSKHSVGNCETHSRCSSLKSTFLGGKGKEAMEKATSCTR